MKTKAELQHQLDEVQTQVMTARQEEGNKVFAKEMENQRAEIMSRLPESRLNKGSVG